MRRTFGAPDSGLFIGLFLACYGYACNLALVPWICFSDWGRDMAKKKMGDADVMTDPIFLLLMTFQPRYLLVAIVGGLAGIWAGAAEVLGACSVLLAASATHAAWRVMRWSADPT